MISVLIVDDEYLLRSLIRNTVEWDKYGLQVIGECSDGEEAYAFIEEKRPDIALVDINMPFMNGLELSKAVHEKHLPTKIIILTGYDKFEYARIAINYKVSNYVLKPIEKEELEQALAQVRQEVAAEKGKLRDKETGVKTQNSELFKQLVLVHVALRRHGWTEERIEQEFVRGNIRLSSRKITAIALQFDQKELIKAKMGELLEDAVLVGRRYLMECSCNQETECFKEIDNTLFFLLNLNEACEKETEKLRKGCEQIAEELENKYGQTVYIGVGTQVDGFDNIFVSVQTALRGLEGQFYQTSSGVFFPPDMKRENQWEQNSVKYLDMNDIMVCMRSSQKEESLGIIKKIFERFRKARTSSEYVKMTSMGLAAILYELASDSGHLPSVGTHDLFIKINECRSIDELEDIILQCYSRYVDEEKKNHQPVLSDTVLAAKKYIEQNFKNCDLTLKEISEEVYLNSTYISSRFKKELNISVKEYITMCRMKYAMRLMEKGKGSNLVELSEECGYTDPYYFSKCFKKYYGAAPSSFLSNDLT